MNNIEGSGKRYIIITHCAVCISFFFSKNGVCECIDGMLLLVFYAREQRS